MPPELDAVIATLCLLSLFAGFLLGFLLGATLFNPPRPAVKPRAPVVPFTTRHPKKRDGGKS